LSSEASAPIRVVITGGSVSLIVTPARTERSEGNYGELLPSLLAPSGVVVDVRHQGKWFDLINELRSRYEFSVRNHFPDVLVLNYGMGECQTNLVPTWLTRHISTWDVSSHPVARAYRRTLIRPLWRVLRRYQQLGSAHLGLHSFRLSPGRFRFEMERVITMAREETGCLVLVLDCDPPGSRFSHWMPTIGRRWELYQQVLADLVADINDPDVRLVPASRTILDDLGVEVALPDGIHRTAAAHRKTAELLAAEILQWIGQPARLVPAATPLADRDLGRRRSWRRSRPTG
jgi:lysophospholipase L1-like esterase